MTEITARGRRSGWSTAEDTLLWETADEAQQQGLPLKAVFERIAQRTGRRPNSIRNYYYAKAQTREDGKERKARFTPFEEDEVNRLMETVLREKASGSSVRACLHRLSGGDHSLMLRYQNKYRSVLKTRPEMVGAIVEKLNAEGIECDKPQVNSRRRQRLPEACEKLTESAKCTGDAELARACETIARRLLAEGGAAGMREDRERGDKVRYDLCRMALQDARRELDGVCEAARPLIACVKEHLAGNGNQGGDAFLSALSERIGPLEEALSNAEAK